MLKILQKVLFLSSFAYTSIFSMRQIPKAALTSLLQAKQFPQIISTRYEQVALFNNSSIRKCPALGTLVGYMMNVEGGDQGIKNELNFNSNEVTSNLWSENGSSSIHNHTNNVTFVSRFEDDESSKTIIVRGFGKDGILSSKYEIEINFTKSNSNSDEATLTLSTNGKEKSVDQKKFFDENENLKNKEIIDQAESFGIAGVLKSGSTVFKPQSSLDTAQGRSNSRIIEADQQFLATQKKYYLENQKAISLKEIKSQVSAYSDNFFSIIKNRTEDILTEIPSVVSRSKITEIATELRIKYSKLKSELQSLNRPNRVISEDVSYLDLNVFFEKMYYSNRSNWTDPDYTYALRAYELKSEIAAIENAIQVCTSIIDAFKNEINNFESALQNLSIEKIEQEVILSLTKQKEEVDRDVAANKAMLNIKNNEVKDIENELNSYKKKLFIRKSVVKNLESKLEIAKTEQGQAKEDFQLAYEEQQKYKKELELAQDICNTKKIELQEQRKKEEKEIIALHHQAVQEQHEACIFDSSNCRDSNLVNQLVERQNALSESKEQDYQQYNKQYTLDQTTSAFLATCGIDSEKFKNCLGTSLQQHFHTKVCDFLSEASRLQTEFDYQRNLQAGIVEFANIAHDANKDNQILLTSQLLDVCFYISKLQDEIYNEVMSYAQAAMHGIYNGSVNTFCTPVYLAEAVYYAVETAALNFPGFSGEVVTGSEVYDTLLDKKSEEFYESKKVQRNAEVVDALKCLGNKISYISETLALNFSQEAVIYPEIYGPMRNQRNAEIAEEWGKITGPEKFEKAIEFGSYVALPKLLNSIGRICGFTAEGTSTLRALKDSVVMVESQGVNEEIIQTVEKIRISAQKDIAKNLSSKLIEADKNIAIRGRYGSLLKECEILTKAEVINALENYGYKIPKKDLVLYHNVDHYLKQACNKINTKLEVGLLEEYKKMTQVAGNRGMSVCMDLEHTVNISYELIKDKSGAFYTVELKGGHLAGTIDKLVQEKLVKIESFFEFGNGCKEYEVKDLLSGSKFTHTEFPPHWNAEKIAKETRVACENAIKNGSLNKDKHVTSIMTKDGFELKIVTNPKPEVHVCESIQNTVNRHIITARPDKG